MPNQVRTISEPGDAGQAQREADDDDVADVRQQVAEDDARRGGAGSPRRHDELGLAQGQDLRPMMRAPPTQPKNDRAPKIEEVVRRAGLHDATDAGEVLDVCGHAAHRVLHRGVDQDEQEDCRQGGEDVADAHDHGIHPATDVAGEQAEGHGEDEAARDAAWRR